VRIAVTAPPLLTMACHCSGCQKLSASAYSLSVAVPASGFQVTLGEPVIGGLHGEHQHLYCPYCKNWMFTRLHGLDIVNVRASALDDHGWYSPFAETCTAERLPWATTPARHSFPGFPEPEAYAPLMEAFAREGPRPG
jgi:hypothetical protein